MRICIDIDGTICVTRQEGEQYKDVKPILGAVESIQKLKKAGHYIILQTSRHMKTTDFNIGQILAKQGKTLFEWLDRHGVPYDEIWFGKPLADIYIDDKAHKLVSWEKTLEELSK